MKFAEEVLMNVQSLASRAWLFLQRNNWPALVGSALLGLAAAKFLYSLLSVSLLAPPNQSKKPVRVATASQNIATQSYNPSSIVGGPIFPLSASIERTGDPEMPAEPVINFELVATIEGHPSIARALIKILGEGSEIREYKTWQKIGQAHITYIGREYIWYRINGQKIKLKAGGSTTQAAQAPSPSGGASQVKKVISREEVNRYLKGNMEDIYKNASFGPELQDGKITGYKIKRVQPGHIFFELGARSGDVLTSVNGYPLSSTERMFEIWKTLPSMDSVSVELMRGSEKLNYQFTIQN